MLTNTPRDTTASLAVAALLRNDEVADLLRVSLRTVRRLVLAGELRAVYVGTGKGSPRIDPASLLAFLERRSNVAAHS